ncbi:MAG: NmrA family NAD(P)-binding protein [Bacteroidales bacterium]
MIRINLFLITFLYASFYWENMIYFGMGPKKNTNGKLSVTFPLGKKKIAGVAASDIGKVAYGIFRNGQEMIGKSVGAAGDQIDCNEMARILSTALGKEVVYNEVTPDQYRSFGFQGADDLGNMFQFYRDFDYVCNSIRDVGISRQLNPELQSFREWVSRNVDKLPLE